MKEAGENCSKACWSRKRRRSGRASPAATPFLLLVLSSSSRVAAFAPGLGGDFSAAVRALGPRGYHSFGTDRVGGEILSKGSHSRTRSHHSPCRSSTSLCGAAWVATAAGGALSGISLGLGPWTTSAAGDAAPAVLEALPPAWIPLLGGAVVFASMAFQQALARGAPAHGPREMDKKKVQEGVEGVDPMASPALLAEGAWAWLEEGPFAANRLDEATPASVTQWANYGSTEPEKEGSSTAEAEAVPVSRSRSLTVESCVDGSASWFPLSVLVPLGLGNAADAVEVLSVGYVLPLWHDPLTGALLSSLDKELVTSSVFLGMLCGGLASGLWADVIGRRRVLLLSLAVNSVFGALSALATSVPELVICRAIAGIGVGGSIPSVFTLGTELFPTSVRGKLLTGIASFWMVGALYAAGVAWLLLGESISGGRMMPGASWRDYLLLTSLPALAALLLNAWLVPESPRFLSSSGGGGEEAAASRGGGGKGVGGAEKAARVLSYMTGESVSTSQLQADAEHSSDSVSGSTSTSVSPWAAVQSAVEELFSPSMAKTTCVLMAAWFLLSYGSYGIAVWNMSLFSNIGLGNAYLSSFIFAAFNLPGNVASFYAVEKIGRKEVLVWGMGLAAVSSTLFACGQAGGAPLLVTAAGLFNAFSVAGWNALDCLSTESFPTSVRTTGMGLAAASGRLGSIAAQVVNGNLEQDVGLLLLVTSGLTLLGSLVCAMLPSDTRGRSLDERLTD